MEYNTWKIKLTPQQEIVYKREFEECCALSKNDGEGSIYFDKVCKAYEDFDFSVLDKFNEFDVEKVREQFYYDSELSSQPLLFIMYVFHRNGFLDKDYFQKRVYDASDKINFVKNISKLKMNIPEGLITEDGKLYGIGKDGHIWLFNFLKIKGVNMKNAVRYGNFTDRQEICGNVVEQRFQFFSRMKEFTFADTGHLYITEKQARAINNLRVAYNPTISLQNFLMKNTANLGFVVGDSNSALQINFDTFANEFPEEYLDKKEIMEYKKINSFMSKK